MKLLVINNLASGMQDGLVYDYLRFVAEGGDDICLRCTDGTRPVASMVDDADQFDVVVVAGGDGTVAGVASALAYGSTPILPLPAGTGNLLVANLRLPLEPQGLASITRELCWLDFDLGEIEAQGRTFGFCIMAGAGYDATIMHNAQPSKRSLGAAAYFQAALANPLPQKSRLRLKIDDREVESQGLGVLFVNFPRIQFEIPLTPFTDPRDGQFEVALLKAENAFGLIPALIAGLRDREGEHPDRSDSMELLRGRKIELWADPPFDMQFDGETPAVTTPFSVRVLPRAARFVLGPEAYDYFSAPM